MAKNNWADEAFKKAQNLMSRGYSDFQPTTVVTRDQLSDLSDAITTSRPRREGSRTDKQLDTNMRSPFSGNPWNLNNDVETTPYEEDSPIQMDDFEAQAKELNTERFNVWDGAESEAGAWARDIGLLKDRPDEDYHTEKELKMAVQLVEKEIQKNSYNSFTSQTKEEKAYKDKRVKVLQREKSRLVEKYQAKSWAQGGSKENLRKVGVAVEDTMRDSVYTGPLSPTKHNNPGNIEKTDIKWDGEGEGTYGDNDRFTSFDTPEAGIAAMTKDLTTKLKDFNGDLKSMINKYAPELTQKELKNYMQVVQKTAGKKYKYTEADIENIVKGFIRMENKKETADYYINIMDK